MSEKSKPLMLRLPREQAQLFQRLTDEFGGLPPGTILKMALVSFLERSFDEQVSEIERQVRRKPKPGEQPSTSRLSRIHRNTRHS